MKNSNPALIILTLIWCLSVLITGCGITLGLLYKIAYLLNIGIAWDESWADFYLYIWTTSTVIVLIGVLQIGRNNYKRGRG